MRSRRIDPTVRRGTNLGFFAIVVAGAIACASADENPRDQAQAILQQTGIRGGLIVHVGCGDGRLTVEFASGDAFLVQGLDRDAARLDAARDRFTKRGLSGKVSATVWTTNHLPYIDNVVNLLVIGPEIAMPGPEVLRVLAPGGVAYRMKEADGDLVRKPWPEAIDRWTHFLHDSTNNAVAADAEVGPPRHMQWLAGPLWSRNHHTLASTSAVVANQGRLFYVMDEATPAAMNIEGRWFLIGRDAFSGVELWRRPVPSWAWHKHRFRAGPVQLPRMLVAGDECVYFPLGLDAPLSRLDAATGEILAKYEGTEGTEEVVLDAGVLLVVVGSPKPEPAAIGPKGKRNPRFPNSKSILAIDAASGKRLWKWTEAKPGDLMPLTLAAADGRVFFQDGGSVVCVERDSGKTLWRFEPSQEGLKGRKRRAGWSISTLVVHEDVVLWADRGRLSAVATDEGKLLWDCPADPTFHSPVDIFVIDHLVWIGQEFAEGRDLHTGNIVKRNPPANDLWTVGHHHRCYRNKATGRYILTAKRGVEFFDLVAGQHSRNNWVRGVCQYGILPCNGLLYAPPHACGCYMEAKLYGFWALSHKSSLSDQLESVDSNQCDGLVQPVSVPVGATSDTSFEGTRRHVEPGEVVDGDGRLTRGPAYGAQPTEQPAQDGNPADWPTFRHDKARSGSTWVALPKPLAPVWRRPVGGPLSPPVVGQGLVIVASIDAHQVTALDEGDGRLRWQFATGGRVDSPPTIHRGLVLFGSADGYVYCLRASDGSLVWRFRAAPADYRTVAEDRVESVWPVHGSVLIVDDVAYVAAGRSSYLDGGISVFALDPATGRVLHQARIRSPHGPVDPKPPAQSAPEQESIVQNMVDRKTYLAPDYSDAFSMAGVRNDVLVAHWDTIYLRHLGLDRELQPVDKAVPHLFSTTGLLDDSELHRTHRVFGRGHFARLPVAYSWIANRPLGGFQSRLSMPYGLLLTIGEDTIWGVRRMNGYTLFAEDLPGEQAAAATSGDFHHSDNKTKPDIRWTRTLTLRPRAMLRAADQLVIGGMPETNGAADPEVFAGGGRGGLLIYATDGSRPEKRLVLEAPPVWDGMAVADEGLFIATVDGHVVRLGK